MKVKTYALSAACMIATGLAGPGAAGEEGMFPPFQASTIANDLRKSGLRIDPEALADVTAFPLGAVMDIGGCTASFVSDRGLIITNHHCAHGSIQFNSNSEANYLRDGFLAHADGEELPAAPGESAFIALETHDVTSQMLDGVTSALSGEERAKKLEQNEKALITVCENAPGHDCRIASFFGGAQYTLEKRLEIEDLRLVYAPASGVGFFGGDIDNWQWPRHTGDFAFYRAYVAPNGSPAPYSKENIPYTPQHQLKVSARDLKEGDFIMVAGFPFSTKRHQRLPEVRYHFDWYYPNGVVFLKGWIDAIERAAPAGSEKRIKYASTLAGLNNGLKNMKGQLAGAKRTRLVEQRIARETALDAWIAKEPDARSAYADAISALDALSEESSAAMKRRLWLDNATRSQLLETARTLYRLSKERQKPDIERKMGFQERDLTTIRQRLELLDRRYDPTVDKAVWSHFLNAYIQSAAEHKNPVFDKAFGLSPEMNTADVAKLVESYFARTRLEDGNDRLALMDAAPSALLESGDPFLKLAAALYEDDIAREREQEDRKGREAALRPIYMQAVLGWSKAERRIVYPDANGTLRITYGAVIGGSPQDGLIYEPFTRLEGLLAKNTGEAPFDAPEALLDRIRAGDYGAYKSNTIGSTPVNFLSDLDITGGNSGSPTLNSRGELVGLLFDGTLEGVVTDWAFDARTARAIHVDSRYILWVMEKVDGATRLLDEMDIVH